MNRKFFDVYQYLGPLLFTPLAYGLWWRHYHGDHRLTLLAVGVPIVFAYVVPAVGTNVLRVWEFDTRLRLGRFRPHHGFVFGSATAIIALLCFYVIDFPQNVIGWLLSGVMMSVVLGMVNWIYDIYAIRAGILKVYNQPYAQGRGAVAIATDYAPWFFSGFGLIYGAGLAMAQSVLPTSTDHLMFVIFFSILSLGAIIVPTACYVVYSYLRYGHHGCKPFHPQT